MTLFERILLVAAAAFSFEASMNAREAHKHTHEIACAVSAHELCAFHEDITP